jgi:hypothetical protein
VGSFGAGASAGWAPSPAKQGVGMEKARLARERGRAHPSRTRAGRDPECLTHPAHLPAALIGVFGCYPARRTPHEWAGFDFFGQRKAPATRDVTSRGDEVEVSDFSADASRPR